MTLPRILAAAVLAGGLGAPAAAATLGLTVDPSVSIAGSVAGENDTDPDFGFGFSVFGTVDGAGFDGDPSGLDLSLEDFAAGPLPFGADLVITQTTQSGLVDVLIGTDLLDLAVESDAADDGDDVIELLFGGLSGSAADDFGARALVVLTGEFGADPIGAGFGFTDIAFVANPVAPIPLPAGGVLMLGALAGLGALRRRA